MNLQVCSGNGIEGGPLSSWQRESNTHSSHIFCFLWSLSGSLHLLGKLSVLKNKTRNKAKKKKARIKTKFFQSMGSASVELKMSMQLQEEKNQHNHFQRNMILFTHKYFNMDK